MFIDHAQSIQSIARVVPKCFVISQPGDQFTVPVERLPGKQLSNRYVFW